MSHGGGQSENCEPNLTPLLDVVMQLLMFFIMCVNFVGEQVSEDIKLPNSTSVKPMDKADNDVLYINFKPYIESDFVNRYDAAVMDRLRSKFQDGDQCILVIGKEPMKLADLRLWLKDQYLDAKRLAEQSNVKDVRTAIVIRAHENADYTQVFEILQACKDVGYTRLKLRAMTKNAPGGASK